MGGGGGWLAFQCDVTSRIKLCSELGSFFLLVGGGGLLHEKMLEHMVKFRRKPCLICSVLVSQALSPITLLMDQFYF